MLIWQQLQSLLFGNPNVFVFRILNPDKDVMYDDLLAPDLIGELSVYPAQEKAEFEGRILTLETDNDLVTADSIIKVFNRYKVNAELIDQKQKL